MDVILSALYRQLYIITRYRAASALMLLAWLCIFIVSYRQHTMLHAFGYFFAMWFCALITDVVVIARPARAVGFPIKHSPQKESMLIIVCALLGIAFLIWRFFGAWNELPTPIRLASLLLMVFAFPIFLAVWYLFRYKYRLRELGINLHYWYLPLFIHIVVGGITLWLTPESSHWKEAWHQDGLVTMLINGILAAALAEEFSRMLAQTRFSAALNDNGLGFFFATLLWALMHIPVFSGGNVADIGMGALGACFIIPMGLLWGYVTWRTKSLVPVLLLHGLNLWGLQNF